MEGSLNGVSYGAAYPGGEAIKQAIKDDDDSSSRPSAREKIENDFG